MLPIKICNTYSFIHSPCAMEVSILSDHDYLQFMMSRQKLAMGTFSGTLFAKCPLNLAIVLFRPYLRLSESNNLEWNSKSSLITKIYPLYIQGIRISKALPALVLTMIDVADDKPVNIMV